MVGRPRTVSDEHIHSAVARAVGRRGIERLTLADVAAEAGVTVGALTRRFGSKRELLLSFARDAFRPDEWMRAAYRDRGDPLTGVIEAMATLVDTDVTAVEFANHLSFLGMELADAEFRRLLTAQHRRVLALLEEFLGAAADRGIVRHGDVRTLAEVVASMWHGVQISWAMACETGPAEAMRRQLRTVLEAHRIAGSPERDG